MIMITVPFGTTLCNTQDDISAWEVAILTKIRVETHLTHKAKLVALITGLAQCALLDDDGAWCIETTKRHLGVLTGMSPSAAWRGMKWLVEEGLLYSEHRASMRSRCERSRYYPLLPAGSNSQDILKNYQVALPRSLSPVSLHSKSKPATWAERETAPVTSLNDPRHNVWHGHRTAWFIYVTMSETWCQPMTPEELHNETGLSYHALRDELAWLESEGLINWVDDQGRWERRMVELARTTVAQEVALDQAVPNYRAERYARVQAERKLHRQWIAAGCVTKFDLLPWVQRSRQEVSARFKARRLALGWAP